MFPYNYPPDTLLSLSYQFDQEKPRRELRNVAIQSERRAKIIISASSYCSYNTRKYPARHKWDISIPAWGRSGPFKLWRHQYEAPASVLTCVFRPCRKMIHRRKLNHQSVFYPAARGTGAHYDGENQTHGGGREWDGKRINYFWISFTAASSIVGLLGRPRSSCLEDNNYLYSLHHRNVPQL